MYLDALSVRIVVQESGRIGDRDAVTISEHEEVIAAELDSIAEIDEAALDSLQRYVFETFEPAAYAVEFRNRRIEQGASSALGEFIITLMNDTSKEAWGALIGLVVDHLRKQYGQGDDDEAD